MRALLGSTILLGLVLAACTRTESNDSTAREASPVPASSTEVAIDLEPAVDGLALKRPADIALGDNQATWDALNAAELPKPETPAEVVVRGPYWVPKTMVGPDAPNELRIPALPRSPGTKMPKLIVRERQAEMDVFEVNVSDDASLTLRWWGPRGLVVAEQAVSADALDGPAAAMWKSNKKGEAIVVVVAPEGVAFERLRAAVETLHKLDGDPEVRVAQAVPPFTPSTSRRKPPSDAPSTVVGAALRSCRGACTYDDQIALYLQMGKAQVGDSTPDAAARSVYLARWIGSISDKEITTSDWAGEEKKALDRATSASLPTIDVTVQPETSDAEKEALTKAARHAALCWMSKRVAGDAKLSVELTVGLDGVPTALRNDGIDLPAPGPLCVLQEIAAARLPPATENRHFELEVSASFASVPDFLER